MSRSQESREDWAWKTDRGLYYLQLQGYGVLAATYLINRTPSRVLDFKIPLDVLCSYTSLVLVSKLPPKMFGCVAYVHVYFHQWSKLDSYAFRCVFIGYSTTQKGYKCYHPPSQKVYVTLDVTFHEEEQYYVSSSSSIQEERGSELKSFEMENLGCKEVCEGIYDKVPTTGRVGEATGRQVICLEPTGRPDGDNQSHASMIDDCQEKTGGPEEASGIPTICLEPTSRS
ncbi:hypothetical protein Prudu_009672 [Prunus dulcis]|uniref:Retroviral polymerase SH3-like domain-containing protein n=1 Tax=Prunus dulcis TaxID=3755 RepID=A0A4Y1R7B7_PRUDU|nr:hypothetical protein Prudu_009672 [Prunus dulcis]